MTRMFFFFISWGFYPLGLLSVGAFIRGAFFGGAFVRGTFVRGAFVLHSKNEELVSHAGFVYTDAFSLFHRAISSFHLLSCQSLFSTKGKYTSYFIESLLIFLIRKVFSFFSRDSSRVEKSRKFDCDCVSVYRTRRLFFIQQAIYSNFPFSFFPIRSIYLPHTISSFVPQIIIDNIHSDKDKDTIRNITQVTLNNKISDVTYF